MVIRFLNMSASSEYLTLTSMFYNSTSMTDRGLDNTTTPNLQNMVPLSDVFVRAETGVAGATVSLNLIILFCLIRHVDQTQEQTLKYQLASITINDIVTAVSTTLLGTTKFAIVKYNQVVCASVLLLYSMTQLASILNLTMIGIFRLLVIKNIQKTSYKSWYNRRVFVLASVLCIWAFSVGFHIVLYITLAKEKLYYESCLYVTLFGDKLVQFVNITTLVLVPALIVVDVVNIAIIFILKTKLKMQEIKTKSCCMCRRQKKRLPINISKSQSSPNNQTDSFVESKLISDRSDDVFNNTIPMTRLSPQSHEDNTISFLRSADHLSTGSSHASYPPAERSDGATDLDTALNENANVAEQQSRKHLNHAVVTIGMVLFAINLSSLPNVVARCVRLVTNIEINVIATASVYMSLNALLDPFVYCLRVEEIKKTITETFQSLFFRICCRKTNREVHT